MRMEIKNSRFYKWLFSDANIYLSIYSLESYIFEYDLLGEGDKIIYQNLKDKFDEKYILYNIIPKIKKEIKRLLDKENEYIRTEVYFKPKKYDNGTIEYRPLHSTDIITQMAIVSMMNLLIYEVPDNTKDEDKKILRLSNLSRLIPGNFYGNRVSLRPKELFKPWKEQYQEYTSLTNEYLKKYHTSLEYKYEVTLDLEKFFPSVNPRFICSYIMSKLPVTLTAEDREFYRILLHKLLYCKITNYLSPDLWHRYYYDENGTNDCRQFEQFTKGIPQGLPQSYFLGNMAMIPIAELFNRQFPGKSLFYVDDSVIFTSKVKTEAFQENLRELNGNIAAMISDILKQNEFIDLSEPIGQLENIYQVKVHEGGKSYYTKLDKADEGEIFLMCLSRESSHAAGDMFRLYSDEEDNILKERMRILTDVVQKKITELTSKLKELEGRELKNEEAEKRDRYQKFKDRLIRYYKFFNYRFMVMDLMETDDLEKLEKIIFQEGDNVQRLEKFIDSYKNDIWIAAVSLYKKKNTDAKHLEKLKAYIEKINKELFGYDNFDSSYLYKVNIELFTEDSKVEATRKKPYDSLEKMAEKKLAGYQHKHYNIVEQYINKTLSAKSRDEIMQMIFPDKFYRCLEIVDQNTENIFRMVLNTIYSYLFSVEVNDSFSISKRNRKPLSFGEMRILLFVRNSAFTEKEFRECNILLSEHANQLPIDYSVLEVAEVFRTFVKAPVPIDKLILTHQYTCDVWKNGSKHLYFYTLHNQEHAVELIKNVIKIIHAFDYFQISRLDFYIIFLSCYLHDIAMVRIPGNDLFLLNNEEANEIAMGFQKKIKENDNGRLDDFAELKALLIQYYEKVDQFFEKQIREKHEVNSAAEIRNVKELDYLDVCLREFVAEVSVAHGYAVEDVYFTKSMASNKKISMKFDKILLRLADSLDMSMYRVSRPILQHNLEQMQKESAFHWLSHLLIKGWHLETKYESVNKYALLMPKSIDENVILTVFVELTQLSQCSIKRKCKCVGIDGQSLTSDCQHIDLLCGVECEQKGDCSFLCRWFTEKNKNLLMEFAALTEYLRRIKENFFGSNIIVRIEMTGSTQLDAQQFDIIKRYLEKEV